jgi:hypothetical protein
MVNTTVDGNTATATSGPTPVLSGDAEGGGVWSEFGPVSLANDTITDNAAVAVGPGSQTLGGNLLFGINNVQRSVSDTIISGGVAQPADTANCALLTTAKVTDGGHNLESGPPSQCGFSAGAGDLVGVDPLLGTLGVNGQGPPTRALLAGSPALGAGGACVDPSLTDGPPLVVDERGLPRTSVCDIGAFQHQLLASTAAPGLSRSALVGVTLSCSDGTWTGDGPIAFSHQWLRDGTAITGATSGSYVVAPADAGHGLSCRVTAQNAYGNGSVSSSVSPVPVPSLSGVSEAHKSWRVGSKQATFSKAKKKKKPTGTTFKFTLNESATVTLTFTTTGRTVKRKCMAPSAHNTHGKPCKRKVGTLRFPSVVSGAHKLSFQGRLSRSKKLAVGKYVVTIVASDGATHSAAKPEKFTIVR